MSPDRILVAARWLLLAATLSIGLCPSSTAAEPARAASGTRPDIVLIMADDEDVASHACAAAERKQHGRSTKWPRHSVDGGSRTPLDPGRSQAFLRLSPPRRSCNGRMGRECWVRP
jgi:hypothetical protein